jgi:glucose-6-phosphate isomerase
MQSSTTLSSEPAALEILESGTRLGGTNRRYERRVADLEGIYSDFEAFNQYSASHGEELAYSVDESRIDDGAGALIVGLSVLLPGLIGTEYAMTRGHLHVKSDRAELYVCVAGRGILVMDDLEGHMRMVELTPGRAVHVPGGWIHRSVNVGDEPFSTVFCYAADAGQDYEIVRRARGMQMLVVTDGRGGWTTVANDGHVGYQRLT